MAIEQKTTLETLTKYECPNCNGGRLPPECNFCITCMGIGFLYNEKELIGIAEEPAIEILKKLKINSRLVDRDNKKFILTRDYRTDRVNLAIKNGIVSEAYRG